MRDFSPLEGRMRGVKDILDVIPLNPPSKGDMRMKKRFNSPLEGRMRGVKDILDAIPLIPFKGEIKKNNILVNDKNKQLTRLNRRKRNFERT